MLQNLDKYHILLGSKSPRRRELLQQLRIPFNVVAINNINEKYPADLNPLEVAEYISREKADAYKSIIGEDQLLITADTVVICDGVVFGKPKDNMEAFSMLKRLSGKTHIVASGVSITTKQKRASFTTLTEVTLSTPTDAEIQYYIDNFNPIDKAGGYGIQEWIGCVAIEGINGSYYNVMGLPLHRLYEELKQF